MNRWTYNFPFKHCAFKAVREMPSLLISKPSNRSKDHLGDLERRIDLWHLGKVDELLFEGETIH